MVRHMPVLDPLVHSYLLSFARLLVFQPTEGQSDARQMKQFCVEDEQARLCWTTGMRFVKVGFSAEIHVRGAVDNLLNKFWGT